MPKAGVPSLSQVKNRLDSGCFCRALPALPNERFRKGARRKSAQRKRGLQTEVRTGAHREPRWQDRCGAYRIMPSGSISRITFLAVETASHVKGAARRFSRRPSPGGAGGCRRRLEVINEIALQDAWYDRAYLHLN